MKVFETGESVCHAWRTALEETKREMGIAAYARPCSTVVRLSSAVVIPVPENDNISRGAERIVQ